MSFIDVVKQSFDAVRSSHGSDAAIRQSAFENFIQAGVPTRRTENWRYTPLRLLNQLPDFSTDQAEGIEALLDALPHADNRIVIVDGRVSSAHSFIRSIYIAYDSAEANQPIALNANEHPFAVLNIAMNAGVVNIQIADEAVLQSPLQIVHLIQQPQPSGDYTRVKLHLGQRATADVAVFYRSLMPVRTFHHVLYDCVLKNSAKLNLTASQSEHGECIHASHYHVRQAAHSQFNGFIVSKYARIARFDLCNVYEGEGATASQTGLYQVKQNQHVDFHFDALHPVGHCQTSQSVKGLVDDAAKAVANTRVKVLKGASKSVSDQASHHLLMTKTAEVDAKPELEIYHDDVKCTHGATVGQLSEEAIFYLMSRGVARQDAKAMLKTAFVQELLDVMPTPSLKAFISEDFLHDGI